MVEGVARASGWPMAGKAMRREHIAGVSPGERLAPRRGLHLFSGGGIRAGTLEGSGGIEVKPDLDACA